MIDPEVDASTNATNVQIWGRDNILFAETEASDEDMFINAGWVLLHEEEITNTFEGMASLSIAPLSALKRFIRVRTTASVGSQEVKFTELSFYGEDTEPINLDKSLHSLQNMPSDNPGTSYGGNPEDHLFDNNNFTLVTATATTQVKMQFLGILQLTLEYQLTYQKLILIFVHLEFFG